MLLPLFLALQLAATATHTTDLLRAKDQALIDAIAPGNRQLWDETLAPDAVYVDENGAIMNRAEYLKQLEPLPPGATGSLHIASYDAHISGDLATVIHTDDEQENYHGQMLTARYLMLSISSTTLAQAHFAPGVANIRDYAEPEPGLYVAVYNYGYTTSTLTDNGGNKISQVVVGSVPVNVGVDVKLYALSPLLLWITDKKILGANYGAYIGPSFSNANVAAALSVVNGKGVNPETSQFAVGDLFVQPLWLGWNRKHFDTAFGYGFYAPVGKFDTQT